MELFLDLGIHTIIADKTDDAFILEEGIDTNIISRINNDFIIMTNFPNGNFKETNYDKVHGCGADRYICAHEYIDNNIHSFGINEAFEVLRKTSHENTLCSIVFEPLNEWFKTWLFDFKANEIKASTVQRYDVIYKSVKR